MIADKERFLLATGREEVIDTISGYLIGVTPNGDGKADEFDRLIEQRSRRFGNEVEQAREEMWKASEEVYYRKRQEDLRRQWVEYHTRCADNLEKTAAELAAEHRRKAQALMPEEEAGGGG